MLVGLQRMGKTTLLSRLREVNEAPMTPSTFNERVRGEEGTKQSPSVSSRSKKRVGKSWWVGEGEREKEVEEGRGREGQREGELQHTHVHVLSLVV